jgi:hypothetical protein
VRVEVLDVGVGQLLDGELVVYGERHLQLLVVGSTSRTLVL